MLKAQNVFAKIFVSCLHTHHSEYFKDRFYLSIARAISFWKWHDQQEIVHSIANLEEKMRKELWFWKNRRSAELHAEVNCVLENNSERASLCVTLSSEFIMIDKRSLERNLVIDAEVSSDDSSLAVFCSSSSLLLSRAKHYMSIYVDQRKCHLCSQFASLTRLILLKLTSRITW